MSIVIEHLVKRYDDVPVVDDVSLEVQKSELFVMLGSSGSGKSTILRLIAGLLRADSGRVLLEGRDVTHATPQQRGTGFVFQNYSIFRDMTVAENIELGLRVRKVAPADRMRRRDELLDLVGLAGLGERRADELSGGQQQRVAIARALVYEPTVLLLDEPFGALDVKIRLQLRRTLKELQRRLKMTTILVTHDQEEAFDLADRVGVIDRGRLLEVGSPEDVYRRPRAPFTATFLGAGNILVARQEAGVLRLGAVALPIAAPPGGDQPSNVQLLIRPEQVVVSSSGPPPDCQQLGEGTIIERNFSGMSRRLRIRMPRFPRTRQVQPTIPFGEDAMLIDAVTSADTPAGDDHVWVGFRGCHIIEESHPQVLVVDDPTGPTTTLAVAKLLAASLGARASMLYVADRPEGADALRASAASRGREAGMGHVDARVRIGDPLEQLGIEQAERVYDVTVLSGTDRDGVNRLSRRVVGALDNLRNPLLVVKGTPAKFARLLVCTAAGEPGKADVAAGGRLARRLGASAALVYVIRPASRLSTAARDHLDRAKRALDAMDVPSEIKVREAPTPARGILEEIREGDYDLVIIGAHQARQRWIFRADNVSLQVCAGSSRSVLVLKDELD